MKRLYGLVVCILIWYIFAIIIKDIIPYPHQVVLKLIEVYPKELDHHIFASLKRLLIGLVVAIVLGVHIGIVIGLFKKIEHATLPVIYSLYPIPKAALLPIFIIIFGIGDLTKILLIIIIVIFPIIISTCDAIKNIPYEIFYISKTLSLTPTQIYKEVIIPAILPNLFTSLRIGVGTAVAVLYLSETFATVKGLGYYIILHISINNLKMFTAIFVLSVIGYLLFLLIDVLEKQLCRWK
jgi:NitT/TauT family transport system permease protein